MSETIDVGRQEAGGNDSGDFLDAQELEYLRDEVVWPFITHLACELDMEDGDPLLNLAETVTNLPNGMPLRFDIWAARGYDWETWAAMEPQANPIGFQYSMIKLATPHPDPNMKDLLLSLAYPESERLRDMGVEELRQVGAFRVRYLELTKGAKLGTDKTDVELLDGSLNTIYGHKKFFRNLNLDELRARRQGPNISYQDGAMIEHAIYCINRRES